MRESRPHPGEPGPDADLAVLAGEVDAVLEPAPAPRRRRRGLAAPLALPAGFGALLVIGATAAATHGRLSAGWVLVLAAAVVTITAAVAEPLAAAVLGAVGWLTVIGFSRAPYAQLHASGRPALIALGVIGGGTLAGLAGGAVLRRLAASFTLWIVDVAGEPQPGRDWISHLSGPADPGAPDFTPSGAGDPGSGPAGSGPAGPGPAGSGPAGPGPAGPGEPEPGAPGPARAAPARGPAAAARLAR